MEGSDTILLLSGDEDIDKCISRPGSRTGSSALR